MSEVPGNAAQLTADMVQALKFVRAHRIVQASLRCLSQKQAAGATIRELGQFAQQRGYIIGKRLRDKGRFYAYHRYRRLMDRAVDMGLVNVVRLKPSPQIVRSFYITATGLYVLKLYDTIDLSEL
jgi:hypothetical protein